MKFPEPWSKLNV